MTWFGCELKQRFKQVSNTRVCPGLPDTSYSGLLSKAAWDFFKENLKPGLCLSTDCAMTTALPRNMEPTRDKLEWGKTYQLELSFISGFIQNRSQSIVTLAAENLILLWKKSEKDLWVKFQLFSSTLLPMLPLQKENLSTTEIFILETFVWQKWLLFCENCTSGALCPHSPLLMSLCSFRFRVQGYTIAFPLPGVLWCNCWWRPEAFEL